MIPIRTNSDVPIYRQIVDGIQMAVASGRLQPGAEIPSVRAFAQELRLNPNTVARAYRDLEALGVIETRRGLGSVVASRARVPAREARRQVLDDKAEELDHAARQAGLEDDEILALVAAALRERTKGGKR